MNTEESTKNTKEKILEVANELFAKNGYGATSIRDIATAADVNLAAINYHFNNKENLYWKVFDFNYDWIKQEIEKLGKKNITTPELAVEVFRFFVSSGSAIMNTFKIFLSDNIGIPEVELQIDQEERFGPPGQQVFLEKIQNDLGKELSPEGQRWAMKMIFSLLVHIGVMMNTAMMKSRCQKEPDMSQDNLEKSVYHSAQAHLDYLKANHHLWK